MKAGEPRGNASPEGASDDEPSGDHFSSYAEAYRRYRPRYPETLFAHLASLAPGRVRAWDCGTGSGQAAAGLAQHFDEVVASDVSVLQIAQAPPTERVRYLVCRSEASPFPDGRIDLVTVAQALHWFDFEPFFEEVRRVARARGVLGFWTYGLLQVSPDFDSVLGRLYGDVLGDYWLPERRHVEEAYENIPVPFERLEIVQLEMRREWSFEDLLGYLYTWSAGRIYTERHGKDPITMIEPDLRAAWGDAERATVTWPLTLRAFRVE